MTDKFSKRNLELLTGIAMGKILEAIEHNDDEVEKPVKEIPIVNGKEITYILMKEKNNWIVSVNLDDLLPNYVIAELRALMADEHITVIKEIASIIKIYNQEMTIGS